MIEKSKVLKSLEKQKELREAKNKSLKKIQDISN